MFYRIGAAPHRKNLHAVMMVKVDVHGGNNHIIMVMLDIGQKPLDIALVVVVNEGDGAGDFLVAEVLAVLDEAGADHVGHGQGAVVVALLAGHLVELLGQVARDGHGKADNAVSFRGSHRGDLNRGTGVVNVVWHRGQGDLNWMPARVWKRAMTPPSPVRRYQLWRAIGACSSLDSGLSGFGPMLQMTQRMGESLGLE